MAAYKSSICQLLLSHMELFSYYYCGDDDWHTSDTSYCMFKALFSFTCEISLHTWLYIQYTTLYTLFFLTVVLRDKNCWQNCWNTPSKRHLHKENNRWTHFKKQICGLLWTGEGEKAWDVLSTFTPDKTAPTPIWLQISWYLMIFIVLMRVGAMADSDVIMGQVELEFWPHRGSSWNFQLTEKFKMESRTSVLPSVF